MTDPQETEESFEDLSQEHRSGIIGEFMGFLGESKKWWLTPILVVLGVVGFFVILSMTPIGPALYALF